VPVALRSFGKEYHHVSKSQGSHQRHRRICPGTQLLGRLMDALAPNVYRRITAN